MTQLHARRLKSILKFLFTLAVSGLCLYFAARKIEWQRLMQDMRALQPTALVLAGVILFVAVCARAFRWYLVISREKKIAYSTSFWATFIGYLANNILPARAGELIRSVVLGLAADIRKTLVFATALTERIFDAGILLALAFIMMRFAPQLPDAIQKSWLVLLPAIVAILILVFTAPWLQSFWLRLIDALPLGRTLGEKLKGFFLGLLDGVRAFHSAKLISVFLVLSACIWLIDALGVVMLSQALGNPLPLPQATILIAALGFASSVPSTPGYVGVFQAIAVVLLPVFGMPEHQAFLLVSLFQLILLVITALFGVPGWFIMQKRIGAQRLEKELAEADT